MMKCVHLVLLLVLLAAGPVLAQKHKKKSKPAAPAAGLSLGLEKSPVFSKCFTGFALYDPARDSMLYAYQADRYFTPASNTKLLTLYASLKTLGDSIPALQYRREGDLLIFWGTGDPSFLNPHLRPDTLVYEFLRSRKETLLFCPANFKDQRYGSGWMWSDYPYSYQPEKSPFPVYSNVAHIRQPAGVQGQISVTPAFLKSRIRHDTSLQAE
jgi:D-alanyl-D-alanine carboxypeptidase/D-alanyl-D-alanine-endopeptidase (penicillin-binding protein 4)